GDVAGEGTCGLCDVPAAAVAGGDGQVQARVAGGLHFRGSHARTDGFGEAFALANEADAHAAAVEFVDLALERTQEQLHQCADFVFRTSPVLAGKCEQGERLDAGFETEIDAQVDGTRAGAVADHAWPAASLRPAAVAVHDDGEMAGNRAHQAGRGRWEQVIAGALLGRTAVVDAPSPFPFQRTVRPPSVPVPSPSPRRRRP